MSDLRPAIIIEIGAQQNDKGFNDAARTGAQQAKKELNFDYAEYRVGDFSSREEMLKTIISQGANFIIAVGFQNVMPVLKLADEYPYIKFTVIDGIVPPLFPNVQSIIFKDNEGAFLVGMIAAYASKTGIVGFIGGMDVPLIRNFAYGYIQGAKYANPKIRVVNSMIGATPAAWSNPSRGSFLAKKQFDEGVDVVFAAAGGSGLGVLNAAKQTGKLAIGVDTNQNGLYPGTVLTSLVKRVDKAVYSALKNASQNKWEPGIKYLGLKEGALDFAVDNNNRSLLDRDLVDKVEAARDLIIQGSLEVEVYSPN